MPEIPASSPAVASRMRMQARRDTAPELSIRRALFARGLRYRVGYPVPGLPRRTIDIAFPRSRVAVFVDGCYWHGCRRHKTVPVANRELWEAKLASNRARDRQTDRHLRENGWRVVRAWEHDAQDEVVGRILGQLERSVPAAG
jgi:DNA mismatch endonuclease (patch repair protein)